MLDKQTAREIALSCGFKLKEQENGEMDLNAYVYDAFNKVAEYCLNKQWISVDDELPKTSAFYVVFTQYDTDLNEVRCSYYETLNNMGFAHACVTHWQPMPQPPKE